MDPTVWLVLVFLFILTVVVLFYIQRSNVKNTKKDKPVAHGQGVVIAGGRRSRNIRSRVAAVQRARGQPEPIPEEEDEGDDLEVSPEDEKVVTGKVGTKKLKRIQEKAERKAAREQEEALREDRKKREALREKERQEEYEAEKEQKRKEEEAAAQLREEQEKKEQEEYLALKQAFIVEDEGEAAADDEETRGVADFIEHIRKKKIVYLEDLAAEFGLKTQEAIDRIQSLQDNGELTGVIDDRGKFIYISQKELESVAAFIKQRGRVSISDLVTSSNTLINLQPEVTA